MTGINSNYQVNRCLEKNDIKLASPEVNQKLGDIFQVAELTSKFPFTSYSKGAQEFIALLGENSKAYLTIEDGVIDEEEVAIFELEKDFRYLLEESHSYQGILVNMNSLVVLESFLEKHQQVGLERLATYLEESHILDFQRRSIIKSNLATVLQQTEVSLSEAMKNQIAKILD